MPSPSRSSVTDQVAQRRFVLGFDELIGRLARLSQIALAICAVLALLNLGRPVFAPVFTAMLVGMMFGPAADWLEARSIRPALSAGVIVLLFLSVIIVAIALFSQPLTEWVGRLPAIWDKLRATMANIRAPFESLAALQEELKTTLGKDAALDVAVDDGGPAQDIAFMAPAILAEILVFLGALYFFLAARHRLRVALLSFCYSRRLRWRAAHVFRDMETHISRYLIAIGLINLGVGVATALALWAIGVPTPLVFGALAGIANFVPYLGQLLIFATLFVVGVGTQQGVLMIFLPLVAYAIINFVADQIVFPHLVGRALTLNPFVIFVSVVTWIWLWGPLGSLLAVPSLLLIQSSLAHLLPRPVLDPLPARVTQTRLIRAQRKE